MNVVIEVREGDSAVPVAVVGSSTKPFNQGGGEHAGPVVHVGILRQLRPPVAGQHEPAVTTEGGIDLAAFEGAAMTAVKYHYGDPAADTAIASEIHDALTAVARSRSGRVSRAQRYSSFVRSRRPWPL
jgi:hypothetical protein